MSSHGTRHKKASSLCSVVEQIIKRSKPLLEGCVGAGCVFHLSKLFNEQTAPNWVVDVCQLSCHALSCFVFSVPTKSSPCQASYNVDLRHPVDHLWSTSDFSSQCHFGHEFGSLATRL